MIKRFLVIIALFIGRYKYLRIVFEWCVKRFVNAVGIRAKDEKREARMRICDGGGDKSKRCVWYCANEKQCGQCGCFINVKAKYDYVIGVGVIDCEIKKWSKNGY